jgi:hypothetical protein
MTQSDAPTHTNRDNGPGTSSTTPRIVHSLQEIILYMLACYTLAEDRERQAVLFKFTVGWSRPADHAANSRGEILIVSRY